MLMAGVAVKDVSVRDRQRSGRHRNIKFDRLLEVSMKQTQGDWEDRIKICLAPRQWKFYSSITSS